MAKKQTPVICSWEDIGIHFGCVGVVRRASDRRVIHRTSWDKPPQPYGFHLAATCDAIDWAVDHGYVQITDEYRKAD